MRDPQRAAHVHGMNLVAHAHGMNLVAHVHGINLRLQSAISKGVIITACLP